MIDVRMWFFIYFLLSLTSKFFNRYPSSFDFDHSFVSFNGGPSDYHILGREEWRRWSFVGGRIHI